MGTICIDTATAIIAILLTSQAIVFFTILIMRGIQHERIKATSNRLLEAHIVHKGHEIANLQQQLKYQKDEMQTILDFQSLVFKPNRVCLSLLKKTLSLL